MIINLDILFFSQTLKIVTNFIREYSFIKEFSGLFVIIAIPIIYVFGHIIHTFDFISLKIYKSVHDKLNKWELRKYKLIEWSRIILHYFMYRYKVINSIIQENKLNNTWKSPSDFWAACSSLQCKGHFDPANYWYTLSDLFKGLYTSFLFSTIVAFIAGKMVLGIIFSVLMLLCHFRAVQFGDYFVVTVKRLSESNSPNNV
jgi:hypothetical protein